mgnify:CR=1
MARFLFIGLLILSVACMVPLMGAGHSATGHFHHGATASCATCIGPESIGMVVFLLTLLGLSPLMIPSAPPRPLVRGLFHPPRTR